ncbi:MAG: hypothetical protein AABX30_01745 [Nanoarchaeota archaeon]
MIKNLEPLSSVEAMKYLKESQTENPDLIGFVKKFVKEDVDSRAMKEKLNSLGLLKIKLEYIVKIIDLLPQNPLELNKIFTDVSLDENETKQILDTIKEFA